MEAHLADGRILQFPDDTPVEVVQATVKRVLGQQAQDKTMAQGATDRGMRGIDVPAVPAAQPDNSFLGDLRRTEAGMLNQFSAGTQKTSPNTGSYGAPIGEVVPYATDTNPSGYGVKTRSGNVRPIDATSEVALLDDNGRQLVYSRSPKTDESMAPALGRVLTMGTLTGPIDTGSAVAAGAASAAAKPVAQFKKYGIDPIFSVLAKNRPAQMAHNAMLDFFPTAGVVERADTRMLNQTGGAVKRAAEGFGEPGVNTDAGAALRKGAEAFRGQSSAAPLSAEAARRAISLPTRATSFKEKSGALYQWLDKLVPGETPVPMQSTMPVLGGTRFDNPELQQAFADPAMKKWADAIASGGGKLSWSDARNFRTEVGKLIAKPMVLNDQDRAMLNSLYGSVTKDLQGAASAIPGAANALNRADQYYGAGSQRIKQTLGQLLDPNASDESAFKMLMSTAQAGSARENAKKLIALRRSIPDDQWGDVAATVLNKLGEPVASATDLMGEAAAFSPSTFITRYSKLSPTAKDMLFGAEGVKSRQGLDGLAEIISREARVKRIANSSGTTRGMMTGALGAGMIYDPVTTMLAMLGTNLGARVLMNPSFTRWAAGLGMVRTAPQMAQRVAVLSQLARLDTSLAEPAAVLSNAFADRAQRGDTSQ